MKQILMMTGLCTGLIAAAWSRQNTQTSIDGRWDLTLEGGGASYPSWIEVTSGAQPTVRIVDRTGSVHPADDVKVEGPHLSFTERSGKTKWDLAFAEGQLTGTEMRGDEKAAVTGIRAPSLDRMAPQSWSSPQPIFNGKDLAGWTPDKPDKNHWKVEENALVNEMPGANLHTDRKFQDFKLHIEFNCPKDGNSGIYLRGRYELQVEYETRPEDKFHALGSIYGFVPPAAEVSPRPGQWESFDVTLVGRTVTVMRDGVKTIDAQQIPGITGGAIDSHESDPGPIYLQGDHTGGMKYRNITIAEPQK